MPPFACRVVYQTASLGERRLDRRPSATTPATISRPSWRAVD